MLKELLLTVEELEAVRAYLIAVPTTTERQERAILTEVLAILIATARAGNYSKFRIPKHALSGKQREWIKEAIRDLKAAPEMYALDPPRPNPRTLGAYRVTELREDTPGKVSAKLTRQDNPAETVNQILAVTDHENALRIGQIFSLVETS